ncbi:MAG: bifunctional diaminohydroxyphosphoribosylaminopyrimidine deaminase/5-amino-6-(5-phosphoribosylamino)uracil reductase RibD [Rhodothermia bacterium]|nr:bifunctional diaminohydroxyphosphoribosylaminopyrimidine deaminase/5-amino-6-(5-phosphoribosylamino)uracil reductase RibD [Rhodothermia bacterium]
MERCLDLARRGAGSVSPNPMVGSVLVDESGSVIGEGWHQMFGGPHAEVHAIDDAERKNGRDALKSATLVVNLEPCSHHGKTPPCADLIIDNGIPRVVVGITDPNPEVSGRGIERLRESGVDVTTGVLAADCARLNEPFLHHQRTGRPLVILKVAQTLDGFVAAADGRSQWITGEVSRRRVHQMRAELDSVMVGSGTAQSDDPALTVRLTEGRQPWRIVLDREGTLSADLKLLNDEHPDRTIVAVGEGVNPAYGSEFRNRGGAVIEVPVHNEHLDLGAVFNVLGRGNENVPPLLSVLVEAGPALGSALIRERLVDRLHLFVAPKIMGNGIASFRDLGISQLDEAITFAQSKWEPVGDDMLFTGFAKSSTELTGS